MKIVNEIKKINPSTHSSDLDTIETKFQTFWPVLSATVLKYFKRTVKPSVPSLAKAFFTDVRYDKLINNPSKL